MGDFSSYYLYEKYEIIGDELVPLGIFSMDADGTQDVVVKNECDIQCGCPQATYRWIQTDDVICIEVLTRTISGSAYCTGYDKYIDVYDQVSLDNGSTWETTATTSELLEENSSECGYVPPTPTTVYRWVESGTTCVGTDKYKRYIKEVSYDSGDNWSVVTPAEYSANTLVEANSPDCGYVVPQYRTTSGDPYCSGVDKYEDVYSQVSYDEGITWTTTATTPTLVQAKSTDCGFSARTVSTATTCVGVDKHYLDEYQESSDSGATWTTISSSTGTLIEANSEDCGYRTRTISGTPYCDGDDLVVVTSAQTSSDSGSTWTTVSTAITMVESGSSQCHQTVNVTGVTLNKNSMTLNSGSSEALVATVSPSNADDKSVTWSSNNTSVATVNSNGLVSAVTSGSATITVTTTDGGYTAQCSVSVSVPTPPIPTGAKFAVTLTNSSAITAACDSTSAITSAETSSFRRDILTATIGDCVTEIGADAFSYGLGYLPITSLTLSNSVTTLGNDAFHFSSLYDVDLKNVTTLLSGCFSASHNLSSVTMSNVVDIRRDAFWLCDKLVRVNSNVDGVINIPSTVTYIGTNPFANCPLITSVTVDSSNTVYDSRNNCNAAIKTSSNALIIGCKNTVIPNTVRSIGSWAFRGYDIPSITIPDGVTTIGSGAFEGTSLTSITIPDSVTYINSDAFRSCFNLEGLSIGSGVTTINQYAFYRCFSLTSVTIPNNVTFIGGSAFYSCSGLTSVTLGSSVNTIGDNGFKNCTSLQSITCLATSVPSLGSSVFDGTNDCPVYVPSGSVDDYKAAWSSYSSRIQAIPNS